MKQLRILTGWHAGTDVTLSSTTCVVSCADEADVQISDWTESPLQLILDGPPDMTAVHTLLDAHTLAWPDFEPRRFGQLVLCIGPAGVAWPSDVQLLERLFNPEKAARTGHKSALHGKFSWRALRVYGPWAAGVAAVGLLVGFGLVVHHAVSASEQRSAPQPLLVQVREALHAAGLTEACVRSTETGVSVEGLLSSVADVQRLHQLLERFPSGSIEHHYAVASDIAQAIGDALAAPGLKVTYRGQGNFLVSGQAVYPENLKAQAQRLSVDLGPLVERIDFEVAELPPPQKTPVGAMLASTGLEYVQTRDGTKHISLVIPPSELPPSN